MPAANLTHTDLVAMLRQLGPHLNSESPQELRDTLLILEMQGVAQITTGPRLVTVCIKKGGTSTEFQFPRPPR